MVDELKFRKQPQSDVKAGQKDPEEVPGNKQLPSKTATEVGVSKTHGKRMAFLRHYSEAAKERQRKVEAYKKLHKIDEIGRVTSNGNQGRGTASVAMRISNSTVTTLQPS